MALLAVPTLALVVALRAAATSRRHRDQWTQAIVSGLQLAGGLAIAVGVWQGLVHGHASGSDFIGYVNDADGNMDPSLHEWIGSRLISLGNTLIPMFPFRDTGDPSINSIYAPSNDVVHFFFQYWVGLPFGIAIVFFPVLLWWLSRASLIRPLAATCVVAVPLVLFAVHWGSFDSGLMREGLHPWVLTVIVVASVAWSHRRTTPGLPGWLRGLLVVRLGEVGLMITAPSVDFAGDATASGHGYGDIAALGLVALGLVGLAAITIGMTTRTGALDTPDAPRPVVSM